MSSFKEREEGFENQFIHEKKIEFQINGLRNRLFGLWVAENLGLEGILAELYVQEMVSYRLDGINDQALLQKVAADLKLKGIVVTLDDLDAKLDECRKSAQKEFMKDSFIDLG